jgi:hypothetical protein
MPKYDVEIFNASADEPGQSDAIVTLTGAAAAAAASAVSAQESAQNIDLTLTGVEVAARSGPVSAQVPGASSAYINSQNIHGVTYLSGLNPLFDPADPQYVWGRIANCIIIQIRNLMGGVRGGAAPDYRSLADDNPLMMGCMHDIPLHGTRAYLETSNRIPSARYNYLRRQPREDVTLNIDQDLAPTEMNGCKQPASGFSQSSIMPNIGNVGVQEHFGDYAADVLMGTAFASPGIGADDGPDLSDAYIWFNDSNVILSPNINAKARRNQAKGSVISVSVSGTEVQSCVVDSTPGIGVEEEDIFFFDPSGTGYIGYQIDTGGYTDNGNGTATLVVEGLPSAAASTQPVVPSSGWRYSINDSSNETVQMDWNQDGTTDSRLECMDAMTAGWTAWYDRIGLRTTQVNGVPSGRGANGIGRSFTQYKNGTGLPSPHAFTGKMDVPLNENFTASEFASERDDGVYPLRSYFTWDRLMRSLYFGSTYVPDTPNEFMQNKPMGANFEVGVNVSGYTSLSTIDARYVEFFWAIIALVPKVNINTLIQPIGGSSPVVHPHFFLDLNTNFTSLTELGTYDDAGGTVGADGPRGSWTWSTGGPGDFVSGDKRIYARRIGDVMIFLNVGDEPAGYGANYDHTFAIRNPEDIITVADFASLYTDGVLSGGETLVYPNYDTYVNQRITDYMQANTTAWAADGGYDYGPKQPTPYGALDGIEWMLVDDAKYGTSGTGGDTLNQSVNFNLNLWTAAVFLVQ